MAFMSLFWGLSNLFLNECRVRNARSKNTKTAASNVDKEVKSDENGPKAF